MRPARFYRFWLGFVGLLCGLPGCEGGSSVFDWSVSPDRSIIQAGERATYTITIKSKTNINANVQLRVEGVPAGATGTLSNTTMPSTATTATLTVQTPANLSVGTYTLKIFAKEVGGLEFEDDVLLIVESSQGQPDFSLEVDPAEFTFPDIEFGKTFTFFARPLNGFQGTVTVVVSGLSDDLVLAQAPTPSQVNIGGTSGGAGGTFVLRIQPQPPVPSPVDLTVTATSGSITHTRTIRIIIPLF